MGIKGLSEFLRKTCPQVFETIHISEYQYEKLAIDTSLYMCRYMASVGKDKWLFAFIKLVTMLRENEVHCSFIYDCYSPPEKQVERKRRKEAREKADNRVSLLEDAIEKYNCTGEINPVLIDFQKKRNIEQKRLLRPDSKNNSINIKSIEYYVEKMRSHLFHITDKDFETTKQLFSILDIPYIDSTEIEAEALCADLCIQEKVKGVLSEDTDVLAYGCPIFLTKVNTKDGTCIRILYENVLKELELNSDQFLDLCIMCGTDYNDNIFRVGPNKAYQLIKKYGSIDSIGKETKLDISILNHVRVRELFRNYKKSNIKIGYCGAPNFSELEKFILQKNIHINLEHLKKAFLCNNIVIENEKEEVEEEETVEIEIV